MFDWGKLTKAHHQINTNLSKISQLGLDQSSRLNESEYQIVFENKLFKLRYYQGMNPKSKRVALCLYSLINRVDILDFDCDISLILALKGITKAVYVIEWKKADTDDIFDHLANYAFVSVDESIKVIKTQSEIDTPLIDLVGICQGGVFALLYASLHSNKLYSLSLLMTPIDHRYITDLAFDDFFKKNKTKIIPKEMVSYYFSILKPFKQYLGRPIDIALSRRNNQKKLQKIENWLSDAMPLSSLLMNNYYQLFVVNNSLLKPSFKIDNYLIDLKKIQIPILNIYGVYDQLVLPESTMILSELIGKNDYYEIKLNTGHIGIFTYKRYLNQFIRQLAKL